MASSPRIISRYLTGALRRRSFEEKPHLAVHLPSACSGVKALRNTSDARRQAAKLRYCFGPLTPSARSGNLIAGDGTKNGLSRSEQRTVIKTRTNNHRSNPQPWRKTPLDRESPIQVRIHPPPGKSPVRTSWNQLSVGPVPQQLRANVRSTRTARSAGFFSTGRPRVSRGIK